MISETVFSGHQNCSHQYAHLFPFTEIYLLKEAIVNISVTTESTEYQYIQEWTVSCKVVEMNVSGRCPNVAAVGRQAVRGYLKGVRAAPQ